MTSRTNTVKYTEPARCIYSNETGCQKHVVWYTGGGLSLPLDAETKDHHDCRTPVKRNRIPNREFEPEAYRLYVNDLKDQEWSELMEQEKSQYITYATEQPASVTTTPQQKRYVRTECSYCRQGVNYESDGYSISGGLKENTKGQALDLDSEIHDCLKNPKLHTDVKIHSINERLKVYESNTGEQIRTLEDRINLLESWLSDR